MPTSAQHNAINYIELPMRDGLRTRTFYSTVFGWEFQEWGPTYLSFSGAGIDGGFNSELQPSVQGALVILYSRDLEASRGAVLGAGAKLHMDIFPFPGGRRFHFIDPEGNQLAIWSE